MPPPSGVANAYHKIASRIAHMPSAPHAISHGIAFARDASSASAAKMKPCGLMRAVIASARGAAAAAGDVRNVQSASSQKAASHTSFCSVPP